MQKKIFKSTQNQLIKMLLDKRERPARVVRQNKIIRLGRGHTVAMAMFRRRQHIERKDGICSADHSQATQKLKLCLTDYAGRTVKDLGQ